MNRIKILLTAAFAVAAATAVISCNNPSLENGLDKQTPGGDERIDPYNLPAGGLAGFEPQYLGGFYLSGAYDSDGGYDYKDFPVISVISSKTELEQNFDRNNKFSCNSDCPSPFEKYNDDFFTNKFLVIVSHWETSGSNRLSVERIDRNGDIIINRLTPEIGTCDMAPWTVIIPQSNDSKLEKYNAVFNIVPLQPPPYSGFETQYINGLYSNRGFADTYKFPPDPVIEVVSSKTELEQNFNANKGGVFADSTAKYTDDFFTSHFLIIVSLQEGNGGTSHKVESIGGDDDKIVINRFEQPGPAVITNRTIIIPMRNEYKLKEYYVKFNSPPPPPPSYDFGHQYIHGYYSNRENNKYDKVDPHQPVIDVISSKTELERNYNRIKDGGGVVADSIAKYTDGFFTNNFLVVVSFTEGCSYFDGAKLAVQRDGIDDGKIVINRLIPADLTCATVLDAWTVIIPMKNEYKLKEYKAEVNEVVTYPSDVPPPSYDLSVRYVPMSWVSGVKYPQITTISSGWELSQYYKEVTSQIPGFSEEFMYNDSLSAAFRKYTSAPNFFNDNILVVVSLEERSGGTRHKVGSIDANGDIHIHRVLGDTDDMAAWNIIIPQSKNSKLEKYNVVLDNDPIRVKILPAIMELEPETQYIRTGSVLGEAKDPVVISSTSELNRYGLSIPYWMWDSDGVASNVFTDNISKYTDDFFKTNFLVIVPKGEGSGSVRHKVETVDYTTGNIVISRLLPQIGTADIAGWHIVIELKKEYKEAKEYKAVFVDKSI